MKELDSEVFFAQLKALCSECGWVMAVNDESDGVLGVVIGQMDYVDAVLEGAEDFDEYSVYSPDENNNGVLQ